MGQKEKVTPNDKPLPAKSGINQPSHSTLTTPVNNTDGKYWNQDSGITSKILGKK